MSESLSENSESPQPDRESHDDRSAHRWSVILVVTATLPVVVATLVLLIHPTLRGIVGEGWPLLVDRDIAGLSEWARELGWWAPVATLGLMVAQALAFPIPAFAVTFSNGILFGAFWGGLWSIASGTFAAFVCFGIGRGLGEPVVAKLVSRRALDAASRFMQEHGVFAILIARLMPFVPFDPISYAAGVTRMSAGVFVVATFIGQIPAGMFYAYYGPKILEEPSARLIVTMALGLVAIGLLGWLVRRLLACRGSRG